METADKQQVATKRRVPPGFQPGKSGNPRGRPPLTPEQRLERKVQERVVLDIAAEMRQHAAAAVEALRKVIDKGDGAEVTAAARLVFQYAFGSPQASIDLTVNQGTRIVTPEDIRQAALRLASSKAEDVFD